MRKKRFNVEYQVSFVYDGKKDIKKKGNRTIDASTADKAEDLFTELYYETNEEEFVTLPKNSNYLGTSFEILEVKEVITLVPGKKFK